MMMLMMIMMLKRMIGSVHAYTAAAAATAAGRRHMPLSQDQRGAHAAAAAATAGRRRLLAQDQLHQLLLLAAGLRGHLVQVQVVAQVLHLQLHQLGALEQRDAQALARVAQPWPGFGLRGAAATEALLAVHAHVLRTHRHTDTHSE